MAVDTSSQQDEICAESVAPGMDESGMIASGRSEHALLAAGKISVDEFMNMSVDRALAQLPVQLPGERLQMMREIMLSEMEADPSLSALVNRIRPPTDAA